MTREKFSAYVTNNKSNAVKNRLEIDSLKQKSENSKADI